MILALNADNGKFDFALINKDTGSVAAEAALTASYGTADEYVFLASSILAGKAGVNKLDDIQIEGSIVSCVNPQTETLIKEVIRRMTGKAPKFVGKGLKTGLNIKIEHHEQLGSDIVCCAVGARSVFGKELCDKTGCTLPPSFIIADVKYATTLTAINDHGELVGVAIIPGISLSVGALSRFSGSLPDISPQLPKSLLGKNTYDSMNSGAVLSHAYGIDGFISEIKETMFPGCVRTVLTGEFAPLVEPFMKNHAAVVPSLCFEGLRTIYLLNEK